MNHESKNIYNTYGTKKIFRENKILSLTYTSVIIIVFSRVRKNDLSVTSRLLQEIKINHMAKTINLHRSNSDQADLGLWEPASIIPTRSIF